MSFIGKIERPVDDYIARLVAKTRRDDAALLSRDGPLNPDDSDSARLLRVLGAIWPSGQFDETNVATRAPRAPELLRTLGFLDPRVVRDRSGSRLSRRNERDVRRWLLTAAGREIGGLRLKINAIGWCRVEREGAP